MVRRGLTGAVLGAVASALLVGALPLGALGVSLAFERTWGGAESDLAAAVALGPDGSVYTAGLTRSFGAGGVTAGPALDALLQRWTAGGELLWARTWGGTADEEAAGVAVDGVGAAYVAGTTTSFGAFGDAFLVKFDADGNFLWERTWGGGSGEEGRDVALGPDGGAYVAGTTFSFGAGSGDAFLAKFDAGGNLLWDRTWGTEGIDSGEALAIGADGSVYLAGDSGPGSYVAKFAPTGDLLWHRAFGVAEFTAFEDIAIGPDGGVYAVGRLIDGAVLQVLVVKFGADGSFLWARDWGGRSGETALGAAVAADGTVYVTGQTSSFAVGSDDAFLLRLLPSGRGLEARTWGGTGLDGGAGVAVGPGGEAYVAGIAGEPPYTFARAPAHLGRIRGSSVGAPAATVGIPLGTVGAPGGTVTAPSGSSTFAGGFDVALLRFNPG